MLLFIVDEKGNRRELSHTDLERLPNQEVHRSTSLKAVRVVSVPLPELLDRLLPFRAAKFLAAESTEGARRALSAREIAGAVLVYRPGGAAQSSLLLMLMDGSQVGSVLQLRGLHLSTSPISDARAPAVAQASG